jgi:uncharacterized membrane protein
LAERSIVDLTVFRNLVSQLNTLSKSLLKLTGGSDQGDPFKDLDQYIQKRCEDFSQAKIREHQQKVTREHRQKTLLALALIAVLTILVFVLPLAGAIASTLAAIISLIVVFCVIGLIGRAIHKFFGNTTEKSIDLIVDNNPLVVSPRLQPQPDLSLQEISKKIILPMPPISHLIAAQWNGRSGARASVLSREQKSDFPNAPIVDDALGPLDAGPDF